MEIRSRRVGGANYQVPREVRPERKNALAFRWILLAARGGKGKPDGRETRDELIAAANNTGSAIKKKDDTLENGRSQQSLRPLRVVISSVNFSAGSRSVSDFLIFPSSHRKVASRTCLVSIELSLQG
jgi:hypothetical protein